MLSYRPSLALGRLVRSDSQAWAHGEAMAEGSHMLHTSWYQDRYRWLDDAGGPKDAEWSLCGAHVKGLEDMADVTTFGEEGCTVTDTGKLEGQERLEGGC